MPPGTAPVSLAAAAMTVGEKRNVCYEFAQRLHKAIKEYEDDLRGEFMYNKDSQRDWQTMIEQLDQPLRQYLGDGSLGAVYTSKNDEAFGAYINFKLNEAIDTLKSEAVPVDAIFTALKHVTDARFALALWRDELAEAGAERVRYDWSDSGQRQAWSRTFQIMIEDLRRAVAAREELDICRQSRQTSLYREYLYFVAPDATAEANDAELIRLHREAMTFMQEGPARDHTLRRLKKLQ